MRLVTKMSLVAVAVITLTACQKEAEQKPAALDTDEAKQSYSLGVSVGRYLDSTLDEYSKMGLSLDSALILRGVQDAVADKTALTEEEVQTMMTALEEQFREKQTAIAEAEAAQAVAAGKAYLEENAKKEGVKVTESGLQYEVLQAAEGAKPKATDTVKVHYTGTLVDGTKFDSSVDRGEPAQFPLNRVIPGWTEGVQLMNVGSKYKFTIPSELAYGERDMGVIKPNSVLVFEVELLDIIPAEAEEK
ncbi:MAG: peptidylprolyl isomerase [Alteromonadaceae bacterium]|jgi:FKBP-type peptidyl-prolyl cis-trans isomerase FkpA|uniref:Peptidyl-prolyl cis-trans isomerase n=2 Tax=Rheinheimera aquimaris TaxID=412437 RepID=A0ABN1EFQ7_9GAMM|nr:MULTISPECIES: FKBP-type peptidyl-prolyl cis-trans isomerase [Rheinheimera]MBJ92711.1 peptidylprolyl isomerase [Alteromonadaceae bacterium]MCB5215559.1 FKBP-type peptidyl-prolyl cis-trans isomerase [Rheinheimera aquimaris]MCD1599715.1 FKBP-type peptidyl-prolyl cis-trans isomerase [Rheinheimera aquimaris]HBN89887.1 FKBP-type peptidyl-prolyl cis-trans isomerase [Rheinheimera sp.]|tara:strand:+ start:2587 stop:3327 length:741 start_codon:yes stop_codon:yes gene_type:complete